MKILAAILFYSFCSSTLLIINKLAVQAVGSTSLVLIVQFVASVLAVFLANAFNPKAVQLGAFTKSEIFVFLGVVALFCFCLYSNVKALETNAVETVIVFRALSPIGVSFLEYKFLGQEFPSSRTCASLTAIAAGSVVYAMAESRGSISGVDILNFWLMLYFIAITFEMAFVKFIIERIPSSTWTRMYYNNLLSIPVIFCIGTSSGDLKFADPRYYGNFGILLLAGIVGVAISYAGFQLRGLISATSFTVVGVLCKLVTLLISRLIWQGSSNLQAYCGLFMCILAGCFYEQAPKRPADEYVTEVLTKTKKLIICSKTVKQL